MPAANNHGRTNKVILFLLNEESLRYWAYARSHLPSSCVIGLLLDAIRHVPKPGSAAFVFYRIKHFDIGLVMKPRYVVAGAEC